MKTFEDYIKQAKESKYEEVMLEIQINLQGKRELQVYCQMIEQQYMKMIVQEKMTLYVI